MAMSHYGNYRNYNNDTFIDDDGVVLTMEQKLEKSMDKDRSMSDQIQERIQETVKAQVEYQMSQIMANTNMPIWGGTFQSASKFYGDRYNTSPAQVPMGVSQWKEHGIKHGYWDFFKTEIMKQAEEEKSKPLHPADKVQITPWNAP